MIRKLLKWFIRLCLLLLALGIVLLLCKDFIIRKITEHRIAAQTGLRTKIDRMHVGFTRPIISMQGFTLYNSPEFGSGVLMRAADLHMVYDPEAIQSGELHLNLFRLDLAELNIVRSKDGQTNIVDFLEQAGEIGEDILKEPQAIREFGFSGIDVLDLSLGHIRYLDLRNPNQNREAYFGIKNMEIKNIRSEGDLYGVAAIVLLRSGVVALSQPTSRNTPGSIGVIEQGLDWLKDAVGYEPSEEATPQSESTAP